MAELRAELTSKALIAKLVEMPWLWLVDEKIPELTVKKGGTLEPELGQEHQKNAK